MSADQSADWENRKRGAALGNPYATLCLHCYGRHAPPFDDQCPHESIDNLKARLAKGTNQ